MKTLVNFLLTGFAAILLLAVPRTASADVFETTLILPPPAGGYFLPTTCIGVVCVVDAHDSDFQITSDVFSGGNETVATTAQLSANVFESIGGSPGPFLGVLSIPGVVDFTYLGRTSDTELGTFNTIVFYEFIGSFGGVDFDGRYSFTSPSMGTTTITQPGGTGPYDVSSSLDVSSEVSFDGSPFIAGPQVAGNLQPVPEPSLLFLTGALGALTAGLWFRRRLSIS